MGGVSGGLLTGVGWLGEVNTRQKRVCHCSLLWFEYVLAFSAGLVARRGSTDLHVVSWISSSPSTQIRVLFQEATVGLLGASETREACTGVTKWRFRLSFVA